MKETATSNSGFLIRSLTWALSVVAAALLVSLSPSPVFAAAALPLLSSPVATNATKVTDKAQIPETWVARRRDVTLNLDQFDPSSGRTPTALDVELFDGEIVTLDLERIENRGPGNFTWNGRVRGRDRSQAILTVVNGQMAGTITLSDTAARTSATYQIQTDRSGGHSLRRLNPSGFPSDHPAGSENLHAPAHSKSLSLDSTDRGITLDADVAAADTGSTVNVMVVYSKQTAAAAGSAIGAQIQQAIDSANSAYANSGITTRLNLVHVEAVNYDESGNFNTDLNRLTSGSDGYMDNVATLRDTHAADLVSLFIENGQYCGLAWVGPSANYGFSVINRGCASGNLTFAHELGHNFGALHDPYVESSNSPYAYGHGYALPAAGWRTVMAYNNVCVAAGTSCTRIPYFSNPNLTYGSTAQPLGTAATSDNSRVHNQNAYTVANFRSSVTGECAFALSPTSVSVGAAATSGSVGVTAGSGCAWNAASGATMAIRELRQQRQRHPQLLGRGQHRPGAKRQHRCRRIELRGQPGQWLHLCIEFDQHQLPVERRQPQLQPDHRHRLRLDRKQQCGVAYRFIGPQRQRVGCRELRGGGQHHHVGTQREPDARWGDVPGDRGGSIRHAASDARGGGQAERGIAQLRQPEDRHHQRGEVGDVDELRRRDADDRFVDRRRDESRRFRTGGDVRGEYGIGERSELHAPVHLQAERREQPVGVAERGDECRKHQPQFERARGAEMRKWVAAS